MGSIKQHYVIVITQWVCNSFPQAQSISFPQRLWKSIIRLWKTLYPGIGFIILIQSEFVVVIIQH